MWWRSRQWRKEPSQQGHKCLQNPQQFLEVPAVIYINQAESCTRAVYFLSCYTAQSAGGWLPVTLTSSPFFTQRAWDESWESFGPTTSQRNNCLLVVVKTEWRPSSWREGEGGLGTCLIGKNLVTSPAQPYTGYQKASAREADRRTPGDELKRKRWRP